MTIKTDKKSTLEIHISTGHGKAVKGTKKTSSIQVRDYSQTATGYQLVNQFRYTIGNSESYRNARHKAMQFVTALEGASK